MILVLFVQENVIEIENTHDVHLINLSPRYQSVALDKKEEDHKVTITVGGQEEEDKKKISS